MINALAQLCTSSIAQTGVFEAGIVAAVQDVFSVSFVVNDANGAAVDNNKGKDYSLPLANAPTKDEVHDMRAAQAKAWEEHMQQVLRGCFLFRGHARPPVLPCSIGPGGLN